MKGKRHRSGITPAVRAHPTAGKHLEQKVITERGMQALLKGKHEWICRRRPGCKQGDRKANGNMTGLLWDVPKSENYY